MENQLATRAATKQFRLLPAKIAFELYLSGEKLDISLLKL